MWAILYLISLTEMSLITVFCGSEEGLTAIQGLIDIVFSVGENPFRYSCMDDLFDFFTVTMDFGFLDPFFPWYVWVGSSPHGLTLYQTAHGSSSILMI